MLPAVLIPVEGSPGFVGLVGDTFHGVWCRFPRSHHPRQPLEGVRVESTSLNVAERAKKKEKFLSSCLSHVLLGSRFGTTLQLGINIIYFGTSFLASAAFQNKIT